MTADEIREWRDTPESDLNFVRISAWAQVEIAAQLAELNAHLRAQASDAHLPEECRNKTCSYYTNYLACGPADLTHEGFHSAEKHCEAAQKRMQEWLDNPANDGKQVPQLMDNMCGHWEKAVRA